MRSHNPKAALIGKLKKLVGLLVKGLGLLLLGTVVLVLIFQWLPVPFSSISSWNGTLGTALVSRLKIR